MQELVDLPVVLVDTAKGEQVALTGLTVAVAEGFPDLGIGVAAAAGELYEHGRSVAEARKTATTPKSKCLHYTHGRKTPLSS